MRVIGFGQKQHQPTALIKGTIFQPHIHRDRTIDNRRPIETAAEAVNLSPVNLIHLLPNALGR